MLVAIFVSSSIYPTPATTTFLYLIFLKCIFFCLPTALQSLLLFYTLQLADYLNILYFSAVYSSMNQEKYSMILKPDTVTHLGIKCQNKKFHIQQCIKCDIYKPEIIISLLCTMCVLHNTCVYIHSLVYTHTQLDRETQ